MYMGMVIFSVMIMILTSSRFKVVDYSAASHGSVPTLTSSLRLRCDIILSLAADLLGCISPSNTTTNNQTRNNSHDRAADTPHWDTQPSPDSDPKELKPVPRPFVLDRIQSKE